MKILIELTELIKSKGIKDLNILNQDDKSDKRQLSNKFLNGLVNGKYRTDQDAILDLYGSNKSHTKYRMLKSRIKDKLYNYTLLLEKNDTNLSQYHRSYYKCLKNLQICRLLLIKSLKNSAVQLARRTLLIAIRYRFMNVILETSTLLRNQTQYEGTFKKLKHYQKLAKWAHDEEKTNKMSSEMLATVRIHFAKSNYLDMVVSKKAIQYASEIKLLLKKYTSHELHINFYRLLVLASQVNRNYKETIKISKNALLYLESFPYLRNTILAGEFLLLQLVSYLQLRNITKATFFANKCSNTFINRSVNWIIYMENHFWLTIVSKDYQLASKLLNELLKSSIFKYSAENKVEKWKLLHTYDEFISQYLIIKKAKNSQRKKFNTYKFANEVPIWSKDKYGFNLSILIIQVMFFLIEKEYNKIIDRMEALKIYRSRYLRNEVYYRSNTFIKMLQIMEKKDFNRMEVEEKAEPLYKILRPGKDKKKNTLSELEIIPYDHLWEMILDILKHHESKPATRARKSRQVAMA